MESHAKHAPQATQRLGNALRARGAVWTLSNQASTLLPEQQRAIALALLPAGLREVASCSSAERVRARFS